MPAVEAFRQVEFPIELDPEALFRALQAGRFREMRDELRPLVEAIQQQVPGPKADQIAVQISKADESMHHAWVNVPPGRRMTARIELSVPESGFDRNEVRRLLLTFGRAKVVRPIPLAVLIKFEEEAPHAGDPC